MDQLPFAERIVKDICSTWPDSEGAKTIRRLAAKENGDFLFYRRVLQMLEISGPVLIPETISPLAHHQLIRRVSTEFWSILVEVEAIAKITQAGLPCTWEPTQSCSRGPDLLIKTAKGEVQVECSSLVDQESARTNTYFADLAKVIRENPHPEKAHLYEYQFHTKFKYRKGSTEVAKLIQESKNLTQAIACGEMEAPLTVFYCVNRGSLQVLPTSWREQGMYSTILEAQKQFPEESVIQISVFETEGKNFSVFMTSSSGKPQFFKYVFARVKGKMRDKTKQLLPGVPALLYLDVMQEREIRHELDHLDALFPWMRQYVNSSTNWSGLIFTEGGGYGGTGIMAEQSLDNPSISAVSAALAGRIF